ncbi:hypothetical protein BS618_11120, partial [Rhodococcus erythropolis]
MSDEVSPRELSGDQLRRRDLRVVVAGACILGLTSVLYELSGVSPSTGAYWAQSVDATFEVRRVLWVV